MKRKRRIDILNAIEAGLMKASLDTLTERKEMLSREHGISPTTYNHWKHVRDRDGEDCEFLRRFKHNNNRKLTRDQSRYLRSIFKSSPETPAAQLWRALRARHPMPRISYEHICKWRKQKVADLAAWQTFRKYHKVPTPRQFQGQNWLPEARA